MLSFTRITGLCSRKAAFHTHRRRNQAPVGLESLEGRQLLSALVIGHHGHGERPRMPPIPAHVGRALDANVLLTGTATGTWASQTSQGISTYSLTGAGGVSPLGSVALAGSINHSNVLDAPAKSDTGSVVLSVGGSTSNSQGTFILTLVGVKGSLTSPGGEQFRYTMTGTGAYASMTGSGTVNLVLSSSSTPGGLPQFQMQFNPGALGPH